MPKTGMPSPTKTPTGIIIGTATKADSVGGGEKKTDYRQMCKYGINCYQKNPMHHQKFRHPEKEQQQADSGDKKTEESEPKEKEREKNTPSKHIDEGVTKEDATEKQDSLDAEEESVEPPAKKARTEDSENGKEPETKKEDTEEPKDESGNGQEPEEEKPPTVFTDGPILKVSELCEMTPVERVRKVYGTIEMPNDFWEFWKFAVSVDRANPLEALVPTCGLRLVGPFELLSDQSDILDKTKRETVLQNDLLCHHRYFYDPPELQTVIISTDPDSTFHLGYFRDSPKELPAFVSASGGTAKEEKITDGFSSKARIQLVGDNLFGAVFNLIKKVMLEADPFKQTAIAKLKEKLHVFSTLNNQENDFSLDVKTPKMKSRDKTKVCQTFHGAGLIVPYDKTTQVGYREIPESTSSLKRILRNVIGAETEDKANSALDVLQELITNVQFANDEGDPGMGLELGLDALLMSPGDVAGGSARLDSSIRHLMTVAYDLLNRDIFGRVVTAHLLRRRNGKHKFVIE